MDSYFAGLLWESTMAVQNKQTKIHFNNLLHKYQLLLLDTGLEYNTFLKHWDFKKKFHVRKQDLTSLF